jgi:chromosome segregation ATPase
METFAVEVAVKKYNFMLQDAYGLFNEEIKRLNGDHRQMQDLITFYEDKIKTLVLTIVRLERMVVEINQYLHQIFRKREDYARAKEDAKLTVSDIIRKKYGDINNIEYLDRSFDFYNISFRLQAHEKRKIAKAAIVKYLEEDRDRLQAQNVQLLSEIELLKSLTSQAHDVEIEAKTEYHRMKKEHAAMKERVDFLEVH